VTVESVRAERNREQGISNGRTIGQPDGDDDLEALAADLSFDKTDIPSLAAQAPSESSTPTSSTSTPTISAAMAESDTDTFARISDDDGDATSATPTAPAPLTTPASPMPAQHRTGLRAFADRAMGGR
jgi:hypothetical protein